MSARMTPFRFPVRSGAFGESLGELPKSVKAVLGQGFKLFHTIPAEAARALLDAGGQSIAGRDVDVAALARRLGIPEDDVAQALSATGMLIIAIAAENITPEEFVENAIKANVIEESDRSLVLTIANTVASGREQIKAGLDRETVATRVLPSFSMFESAVEIRLGFKDDRLFALVPVAVAFLDTDATHSQMWFQMSRAQVENLAKEVQDLLRRMEQAEKLIERMKLT